MSHVNTIGMILYLCLAVFGGFLSGLFSHYVYLAARRDLPVWASLLFSVVFYVPPVWAIFSLFKDDDLDIFYILLVICFALGVRHHKKIAGQKQADEREYPFDLD